MSSDVALGEDQGFAEESVPPIECPKCKKFAPAWMTTFADMSTLLMALFAILYSFAEQDEKI